MARLEFEITGTTTGLSKSVNDAIGLLNKLQQAGDKLNLFQNTAQGAQQLGQTLGGLTTQVRGYTAAAQRGSQAWNDKTAANAIDSLSNKLLVIRGNAELFGMSLQTDQQALRAYQGALNSLLSAGLSPTDAKIVTLKGHVDELTSSIGKQKAGLSNAGGGFGAIGNQLSGLLTSYISVFAVIRGVSAIVSSNAEISDSLADVRRTAGLTKPEVDKLFESLKKIDTRTSLKGLVDITVIGGQLGIATDQLVGFTKATDQLNVSLSGEIKGGPDEIAKSLGILNKVFGISIQNGGDIERSFNKIGSVILGLGQSGLATGDFLSDFGQRVGGVAAQAKLSLPVLLSYGAVLQEQGVTAEVAGTAFKKLLGSLATKRSDFFAVAQLADSNLTLKEFTNLINNDTQAALSKFFDGLSKGGPTTTQFQDLLKSVGLDAARSGQAITALALHQQDLNKHIQESTKDFSDGTKAADQFAIKNDTLGGSVDKLSKSFVSLTTSGRLGGFFKGIIDGLTQVINSFEGFINSRSYKEFQRNFANSVSGVIKYSTAGIIDPGKVVDAQPFNSRTNYINNSLQAFNGFTRPQQSSIIETTTAARDRAFNIASDPQATKKQITDYNDINKLLNLMRQSYDALYHSKKSNINADSEIADADLKTTKAIHARIAELKNDALANPSNKDADVQRIQVLTARLKELSGTATGAGAALRGISLSKQLSDILNTGDNSSAKSGLTGLALDVQKINNQYNDLNRKLDDYNRKVKESNIPQAQKNGLLTESDAGRDKGEAQRQTEINNARLKSVQDTANNIQRINDEFGVKATVSRDKELAQVNALADAEMAKYVAGSQERIAIEQGKASAIAAINEKYAQQALDVQAKIDALNETATAQLGSTEDIKTQKVKNEWDKRLADANKYFTELRRLQNGTTQGAINDASLFAGISGPSTIAAKTGQAAITANIVKGGAAAQADAGISDLGKLFNKTFDQSIKQLGSSFSNTITTIGQDGNKTIGDIFSNLQKDISKTLFSTFIKFGTDYLGDALKKGITGGTGNLSDIFKNGISSGVGAGLALAGVGSLISGLTPKTSYAGQGIGGALTGAGAGAVLGTTVFPGLGTLGGALIGGGVGLIGGLFGAKGANKKQQQLQEQQLAEAQKQTALLRQQALAYTASITGKMTTAGIITGVDVNAFGQLTATVSGKDLQFVLDRNSNSR